MPISATLFSKEERYLQDTRSAIALLERDLEQVLAAERAQSGQDPTPTVPAALQEFYAATSLMAIRSCIQSHLARLRADARVLEAAL